ncbi:MAG: hypothetical protein QS721_13800 [Candidatus Endonucleobacter sp. (ex Gigantidas childressi)]|nr:hypothetical protein [Candidatus Endonucleobacter sp. (ex Gigantidas childressi)]
MKKQKNDVCIIILLIYIQRVWSCYVVPSERTINLGILSTVVREREQQISSFKSDGCIPNIIEGFLF